MPYNPSIHHRRSIRLKGHDYTQPAAYFVTLCTHEWAHSFGQVVDGGMQLNECGEIVRTEWFQTAVVRPYVVLNPDEFVVMPNHIHGIIWIVGNDNGDDGIDNGSDARDDGSGGDTPRDDGDGSRDGGDRVPWRHRGGAAALRPYLLRPYLRPHHISTRCHPNVHRTRHPWRHTNQRRSRFVGRHRPVIQIGRYPAHQHHAQYAGCTRLATQLL